MTGRLEMSQQEKWRGMFGRLRNYKRHKRGLSVKAPNGSLENDTEFIKDAELGSISSNEVKSWGDSFEQLMASEKGRKVFRSFLRCEYSEENILFWLACEDLKKERSPELIEEKARIIYEDYVSILSPREVSLDSRVREIINRNMIAPSQHTFDEAQLQIYTLMHRDSYPRFVNSPTYKDLLRTCGVVEPSPPAASGASSSPPGAAAAAATSATSPQATSATSTAPPAAAGQSSSMSPTSAAAMFPSGPSTSSSPPGPTAYDGGGEDAMQSGT